MFSPQVTDPELVVCDNVTGVACSADGRHVLANYLNNHVYMFSIDGVGLGAAPALEASPASSPGRARAEIAAQGESLLSWSLLQLNLTLRKKICMSKATWLGPTKGWGFPLSPGVCGSYPGCHATSRRL